MRNAIALVALAVMLAGCADSAPTQGLDLRATAEREATDLDGSAELVAVFGPEWASETFGQQFAAESPEAAIMNQGTDDNIGDGRANVWGYLFMTDTDPILVVLDAGGQVLHGDRIPPDSNTAESYDRYLPLGEVNIDSVQAAAVVRENNADFVAITEEDDAVVIMALGSDENSVDPYWVFSAIAEESEQFTIALVNAMDGTYTDFSDFWSG